MRINPRIVVAYLAGLLTPLIVVFVLERITPAPSQRYVLIQDVEIGQQHFFGNQSPIQGVLRSGTEFTLTMRKSIGYYIEFNTVVNGPEFARFCRPLPGSVPFLAEAHISSQPK